ncbi:MAG: ATP-binding protein [Candidatus Omnitrophica bacterium]|nr:ATP-binding protein [Candidatus Omnitrophota bacterium]MBU1851522.1 ATP-binding protein [Candidatus Omnitrophota bacterium]
MIKERKVFKKLLSEAGKKKVSVVLGPRQTGKTTAIKFIHEALTGRGRASSVFLDLDIYSNFEKVSTYENALATFKLAGYNGRGSRKFYVFLDEFQRYKDLSIIIKNIYDHHKNIKIYATGSSSLAIKHKIQESLAGRKIITHLYPLDFEEFLHFKGREELVTQVKNVPALSGKNLFAAARELFAGLEEFIIFGGYPEAVLSDKKQTKIEILRSIFDLYVKKELVEYLKLDKIPEVKKLIQYLAVNNAQKIKYQNIAQVAGLSQKTVKIYIELLKETFLIVEVKPFFTNKNKELVKIPKVYFLDPGVANFFINNFNGFELRKDAPFLFENYVISELIKGGIEADTIKFWQDKNQTEIDFVIEGRGALTAIEVKFKQSLTASDLSAFDIFRRDYSGARCFLVNLSSQETFKNIKALLPYKVARTILFPHA